MRLKSKEKVLFSKIVEHQYEEFKIRFLCFDKGLNLLKF